MGNELFIINVEAAIFKDDQYLIVRRGYGESHAAGVLSLVGGKVEDNENTQDIFEETLRREVREEIGIEVDQISYVESHSFRVGDIAVVDIVFLCHHKSGEPRIVAKDEVANIFWMTAEAILNHPEIPIWTKDSIKRAEIFRKTNLQ